MDTPACFCHRVYLFSDVLSVPGWNVTFKRAGMSSVLSTSVLCPNAQSRHSIDTYGMPAWPNKQLMKFLENQQWGWRHSGITMGCYSGSQ